MKPAQKEQLRKLLAEYAATMPAAQAQERLKKIDQAGFDKLRFGWAGGLERGEKHYYRIQGPTFLLEYDSTQNDGNHIHSVWRDFNGDFGRDLLERRGALRGPAHGRDSQRRLEPERVRTAVDRRSRAGRPSRRSTPIQRRRCRVVGGGRWPPCA